MNDQKNEPREDGPAIAKLLGAIDGAQVLQPGPKELFLPPGVDKPSAETMTRFQGGTNLDPAPAASDDTSEANVGPFNYAHHLHQSGEAAIQIVKNMVEMELAYGNPDELPEPILGWYCMTMAYQLCVLEATLARYDIRKAHADQLQAARNAFTFKSEYADGVRAEITEVLATRHRPKGLAEEHADYRGVLLP